VKVTLKQVAQAANVHYSTVASILNNAGGNSRFSQATQDRVMQVAQQLGYTPNLDAQRLKTNRTMTIGFAAGDIRNPFFAELAIALEAQLHQHGYALLLAWHSQSSPTEDAQLVQKLIGRSVDAMIVWAEGQDTLTPQQIQNERGKVVWLGWCEGGSYKVHVDVEAGLQQIARYLVKHGHHSVGFYSPESIHPHDATRREILFQTIASHHQLQLNTLEHVGPSWDIQSATASGKQAWKTILQQGLQAVVAYNDVAAIGLLLSRPAKARTIPVIGFDGTPLLKSWQPAIPYVHFSMDEMAKAAAELAIKAAQNKRPPRKAHSLRIEPVFVSA
jgi:DNA-binding LacI/PurR family transcriptional regulator